MNFCPQCGTKVAGTPKYCEHCGASLGTKPAAPENAVAPSASQTVVPEMSRTPVSPQTPATQVSRVPVTGVRMNDAKPTAKSPTSTAIGLAAFIHKRPYVALTVAGLVGTALFFGFLMMWLYLGASTQSLSSYLVTSVLIFVFTFGLPVAVVSAAATWGQPAPRALRVGLWGFLIAVAEFRLHAISGDWVLVSPWLVFLVTALPTAAMAMVGFYASRRGRENRTRWTRLYWSTAALFLVALTPYEVSEVVLNGSPIVLDIVSRVAGALLVAWGVVVFSRAAEFHRVAHEHE